MLCYLENQAVCFQSSMASLTFYLHVAAIVTLVIAAGIAYHAIMTEATALRVDNQTTGAFFVNLSAWISLIVLAISTQWIAYRFYVTPNPYNVARAY